ncbi:hypothetical protein ACVR0S_08695 [Streptococcus dentapri]|uniref:Uncharacterized protein n=1 Tax=Streptococcus dentapri TaxID=573564 RepID=A0ABV8D456_9STRE
MNNLAFVISLGLAGIDPVGMMLLVTMQAAGLSKKKAYLYGGLVLFGTAVLGFILSSLLGRGLSDLASSIDNFSNTVWVWINLALILILTVWGMKRLSTEEQKENESGQKNSRGVYAAAVFMMFTALTDPTFLAVLALSGQVNNLLLSILYNLLWVFISQAPLFLLLLAIVFNKHHVFIDKFNTYYKKYKKPINYAVTGLIFLAALVFVADLIVYWFSGAWLLG